MTTEGPHHVHLSAEFLRGVIAAAKYAHSRYADTIRDDIIDGTVALAVRTEGGL